MNDLNRFARTFILTCTVISICCSALVAQDKYAVLVGVETYDPGMFENLKYSKEDAIQLGDVLEQHGYTTTVLTAESSSVKLKPYNPENIVAAIEHRANSCEKGDTLIVSLSGHGVQFKDEENLSSDVKETYFCPEGADLADKSTLIPISKLITLINASKATRKLLLVDACRNEVISSAGQNKSSSRKIDLGSVHESRHSVPGGMSVLFSCSSEQFSWESNELQRSVFSHFVTEYLRGEADERYYRSGKMTLDDFVSYVRKKTDNYVFENNLSNDGQKPVLRGEAADWPLATAKELVAYDTESNELVIQHAKLGFAKAQATLGTRYSQGEEIEKNLAEAIKWLQRAADQGHAAGQFELGRLYTTGAGVAKDYRKAMAWYLKAADQGNLKAQGNIGFLYENGFGVSQDYPEAVKWYRRAADQGNAFSQGNLGFLYANGTGVAQSKSEAMKWFRKAADQGDAWAQNQVGIGYRNGQGVVQDNNEALKWYKAAAEQGFKFAVFNVGRTYDDVGNYAEAIKWYKKSADLEIADAQNNLGVMYLEGRGTPQNFQLARFWFEKAAEQGFEQAKQNLRLLGNR